ncbi:MAG: YmaF family protein [Bacillota bacterium]
MGRKKCEEKGYHVHSYCLYTEVADGHRHIMRGVTSPAPNTPCHKHDYEGVTSCNECHTHKYHGCTEEPISSFCGHVHNFCGKTSCVDDHKHRYEGTTGRDRAVSYR